ncbi:MAG: hypothetical protein U0R69_01030 [Gaiellales bacterium]
MRSGSILSLGRVGREFDSGQVAKILYGSIIVLALEVALEDHPPPPPEVIGSIVGTAFAVMLAELYSDVIALELGKRRRVRRGELGAISRKTSAVGFGAVFPVLWFALAWAGVMGTGTAFAVSKWSGLGLIGFYGFTAGRLAGNGLVRSLVQAAAVVIVGFVIISVKALFH